MNKASREQVWLLVGLIVMLAVTVLAVNRGSDEVVTNETNMVDGVHITFLQINDVYELTPVSGGTQGGVARLATVKNELLAANPDTYMVLAGDLFSPSALGTAKVDGERLAGRQMVAVMNEVGLDYATFGNHEFDIKEEQFLARLAESETVWVSSNVFDVAGQPFLDTPLHTIFTVDNPGGAPIRVGLFGVTLPSNPADYVSYSDYMEAAKIQVATLRPQVDILVAITHLSVAQDIELANQLPEIDLILGGHEHENVHLERGADFTPITKADANARSAYVHHLYYDSDSGELQIETELKLINDSIPDEPAIAASIEAWLDIAFAGFEEQGFQPREVVTEVTEPLDGTEASVRNRPTRLTELIAAGMLKAVPEADMAMFNGGSIRIDDTIPSGQVTEYDIIRVLPFGGTVMSVEMRGGLVKDILDQGQANQGNGGYIQTANISQTAGVWHVSGVVIEENEIYQVAINDFLLTGFEIGLDFVTEDNPDLTVIGETVDIRKALIDELRVVYSR